MFVLCYNAKYGKFYVAMTITPEFDFSVFIRDEH